MSIYGTRSELRFLVDCVDPRIADQLGLVDPDEPGTLVSDDNQDGKTVTGVWVRVWVQYVPGHIDNTGPEWDWLPPPSESEEEPRAVVFVTDWTPKGTEQNGQEFTSPKLLLSWKTYRKLDFETLRCELEDWLETATRERERELLAGVRR